MFLCDLNEYCSDNATCIPTLSNPLFGAPCPYEVPLGSTLPSFCGALHCYQHVCFPCVNGMRDLVDNKVCYNRQWYYISSANPTIMILYSPTAFLLIHILCIIILTILIILGVNSVKYSIAKLKKKPKMIPIQDAKF
jgi:hypothetical protein